MPRVLHVIDGATPADMLVQLSLLAGAEDVVVSIGPAPAAAALDLPVLAVHRLFGSAAATGWRVWRAVGGVGVVHTWSPTCIAAGQAVANRAAAAHVLSIPCLPPPRRLRRLVGRARRFGLTITAPTDCCRRALLDAGADAASVRLLPPPGAAPDRRRATRKGVREALAVCEEAFVIVAPAEMTRPAGHKYASWAHAVVRQIRPELRVLFPGAGPAENHVRFFAQTTGYGHEAFFTGSRFRLADTLAASDMAVLFAERDVGVAALVAAMAAGLPVAATDTPDIAECAGAGEAALLIPRGEMSEGFIARGASSAVLKLMEDRELARRLAASARRRAEQRFSPAASRAALAEVYSAATRHSRP